MSNSTAVEQFWQACRESHPVVASSALPEAWNFGGSAAMADELDGLVMAGIKTATGSARSAPLSR